MTTSTSTKIGHGLAKVLGIRLNERQAQDEALTRGESTYSLDTADTYVEDEPRTVDWLRELVPSAKDWQNYVHNLFPFTKWILKYNTQWLIGDLVAGITIGAVVVPQGMAYAKLAELPVQFGLYTSVMKAEMAVNGMKSTIQPQRMIPMKKMITPEMSASAEATTLGAISG